MHVATGMNLSGGFCNDQWRKGWETKQKPRRLEV
jgi:hypothetical protein